MMDRWKRRCIGRFAGWKRRRAERIARAFTSRETPELLHAYGSFGRFSQSGAPRQPFKGWDLWLLLERFQPRSIVELGSGTTSAVFALWARRHGARYVCYEHHEDWAAVTAGCLRDSGLEDGISPVRVVRTRVREDGGATGFVEPIVADADFVYVDGPPCRLPDGRKVPNDDVVRLLDSAVRPRAIVVDGRLETVDLIRAHREAARYRLEPGFAYALHRGLWSDAAEGREHTVFSLDSV